MRGLALERGHTSLKLWQVVYTKGKSTRRERQERSHTSAKFVKIAFTQKRGLLTPGRSHTGEKPYQCKTCDGSFTQKGNIGRPERSHTGEEPCQCKSYDKCYILWVHERSHSEEKPQVKILCEVFRKVARRGHLQGHDRSHTRQTSYQCKVCQKCFNR